MAGDLKTHLPALTIQHDGMEWRPKRGATATADEFISARALFVELHRDARWNPWVLDDRAAELEQAGDVMEQWTRAEPNFRPLTTKHIDARMARSSRAFRAEQAKIDARRDRDRSRYEPDRERSRLELIEHQSRLDHELSEATSLRNGTRFPGMADAKRATEIAEADTSIAVRRAEIVRLASLVGDPEDVVDKRGWLPQDRRELMLCIFQSCRSVEVRELRTKTAELADEVKAATDKGARAEHRAALMAATSRLEKLLAIPALTADDMCSECPTPIARHGWVTPPADGPCVVWPRAAAQRQKFRDTFDAMVPVSQPPPPPPPPKPEPLAVVPSGLPIADVMERLAQIQSEYPDAEVRRGRANRWEVWPGSGAQEAR